MLLSLTFDLALRPRRGWSRLSPDAQSASIEGPTLLQCGGVAGLAVLATGVGAILHRGADVASVTLAVLGAVCAYLGCAAVAAHLAPRLRGLGTAAGTRYAAAVSLPLLASGAVNAIPFHLSTALGAVCGCALAYRCAAIGARRFLRLKRRAHRVAATTCALSGAPILAFAMLRSLSPS